MKNEIKIENIIKVFKRWALEENQIQRSHLAKSDVMQRFERLIKSGQITSGIDYAFENKMYSIWLFDFYTYMNELDVFTDFFAKCFEDFLMMRGIKDAFIKELNNMVGCDNYSEHWPPRLLLTKKISTIEEYVKERNTTGFLSLVNESFLWSKAKNQYINWENTCTEWRSYIVNRIIQ